MDDVLEAAGRERFSFIGEASVCPWHTSGSKGGLDMMKQLRCQIPDARSGEWATPSVVQRT